jgi:hypothetical protein
MVKHGDADAFPDFAAPHLAGPVASHLLNFAHALNRYAAVFGRSNLAIVSYSELCDRGIDLAEHFMANFLPRHRQILAGLPPLADPRPNRSLPTRDIEIVRALNARAMRDKLPRGSRLAVWFLKNRGRFDLSALYVAIEANIATLTLCDASPALDALHRELVCAWGDRLRAPSHPGALFAPRRASAAFVRPRYLTEQAPRGSLDAIYAAFRETLP